MHTTYIIFFFIIIFPRLIFILMFPENGGDYEIYTTVAKNILNGCGVSALASKATDFLRTKQIDVINSDNADHHDYKNTLIIQRNEKFESLKKIVETFGVYLTDSTRVQTLPDESLGVDVTIILGQDYTSFAELNNYISANY